MRGNVGRAGGTQVRGYSRRVVINEVAGATSLAPLGEVVPSRLGAIRGHLTGSSVKRTTPRLREASASPFERGLKGESRRGGGCCSVGGRSGAIPRPTGAQDERALLSERLQARISSLLINAVLPI
jgi:hypothetical protein